MIESIRVSKRALLDLEEIWMYGYQRWSAKQADEYFKNISHQFDQIKLHPSTGKSIDFLRVSYKTWPIGSHVIFYRTTNSSTIEIVRILHKSMDFLRHLK